MTMMSNQNHRTNKNTAKTSAMKLRNVKPSVKKNMAILLGSPDRLIAGVASSLRRFCCLRRASDLCGRNARTAASIRQRAHAFSCRVAARGTRRKLSRTADGESTTCRLDMLDPRLQLVHAIELPVDAFQRSGEHL